MKNETLARQMQPHLWVCSFFGWAICLVLTSCSCEPPVSELQDAAPKGVVIDPSVYNWPPGSEKAVTVVNESDRLNKNFYVILDGSGSMDESGCSGGETKALAAIKALRTFAEAVPQDANLGLLIFDNRDIKERVPLGTNNRKAFNDELSLLEVGGGTPLSSAITQGLHALELQARAQLGYGEYHLVMVTDGEANDGEDPEDVVYSLISKTPIIVHTVGFCIGESHSLNQPGRTMYKAADNPGALLSGLEGVLAESPTFDAVEFGQTNPVTP